MTSTRAIAAAADVICRAMKSKNTTPANLAFALDSACLLNSPETARELEELRKRVAELEAAAGNGSTRTVDEDPIAYVLTPEALHASSGAVIETTTEPLVEVNGCGWCGIPKDRHGRQWALPAGWHAWNRPTQEQIKERMRRRRSVAELKGLLARQVEDPHDSDLHHTYAVGRDLPEVRP